MIKVGIVLINYNSINEVFNFVRNELSKLVTTKKIVIINNSSIGNNSTEKLSKLPNSQVIESWADLDKNKQIYILDPKANLGYAKANNLGAQLLIQKFSPEFLLFSNTDILISDNKTLEYLIKEMKTDNKIAACNPKIIGSNGKDQTPGKFIPFHKRYLLRFLLFPFIFKMLKNGLWSDIIPSANKGYYYRLSGSFLLFNSDYFQKIGMFDENTFLFAEELILAEKIKLLNLKCGYFPLISIIHKENEIIGNSFSKLKRTKLMFQSDIYYYRKYIKTPLILIHIGRFSFYLFANIYRPIMKKLSND